MLSTKSRVTANSHKETFKSRLSLIVRVNVVLNRSVVVDSVNNNSWVQQLLGSNLSAKKLSVHRRAVSSVLNNL